MRKYSLLVCAVVVGAIAASSCAAGESAATFERNETSLHVPRPTELASAAPAAPALLRGSRADAARLIEYYNTIQLTAEQERVKNLALTSVPAPCCSNFSIATCCCPCNLAKSVWGLAHHLIANERYDAPAVRQAVVEWLQASNPDGYSGDACYSGGCQRAFSDNGCGGMNAQDVL